MDPASSKAPTLRSALVTRRKPAQPWSCRRVVLIDDRRKDGLRACLPVKAAYQTARASGDNPRAPGVSPSPRVRTSRREKRSHSASSPCVRSSHVCWAKASCVQLRRQEGSSGGCPRPDQHRGGRRDRGNCSEVHPSDVGRISLISEHLQVDPIPDGGSSLVNRLDQGSEGQTATRGSWGQPSATSDWVLSGAPAAAPQSARWSMAGRCGRWANARPCQRAEEAVNWESWCSSCGGVAVRCLPLAYLSDRLLNSVSPRIAVPGKDEVG